MRKDLVAINKLDNDPSYKYLNISRHQLLKLASEGLLTIIKEQNTSLVSLNEVINFVKKDRNIKENYISLESFTKRIFNLKNSNNLGLYKKAVIENQKNIMVSIEVYRDKKYITKTDTIKFLENFIHKSVLINNLNLSFKQYEALIKTLSISEIYLTPKNPFLRTKDIQTIQDNLNTLVTSSKEQWITAAQVVKNEKYKHLAKKSETLIKIAKSGYLKIYFDFNKVAYIEKSSLETFSSKVKNLQNEYYKLTQVTRLFGIKQFNISNLKNNFIPNLFKMCDKYQVKYIELETPIENETIYIERKALTSFLEEYISNQEIVEFYNISYSTLREIGVKYSGNKFYFYRTLVYYHRKAIKTLIESIPHFHLRSNDQEENKLKDYFTLEQVKKLLNANDSQLNQIRKQEELKYFHFKETTVYLKSDINRLIEVQKEVREKYVSSSYIHKKLGEYTVKKHFTRIKCTTLLKVALNLEHRMSHLYLKEQIDSFIDKKVIKKKISEISYSDPFKNFQSQLEIYQLFFSRNSWYTEEKWLEFCNSKIQMNILNIYKIEQVLSRLIKCTSHLISLINEKELYLMKSNEINLSIFNKHIPITHQYVLFEFFNLYIQFLKSDNLPSYNHKKLKNPYLIESKKKDKDIYSYDLYLLLFDYVKDINLHKDKAINDALNIINSNSMPQNPATLINYYASSWLYVLIHLNNAWRHRDICNLPRLNLAPTSITSLKQFRDMSLDKNTAQQIINQLKTKDLIASKTKNKNRFFCSEELIIPLATALIICQLLSEALDPFNDNNLIDFGNKSQIFSETARKAFFSNFSDLNFKFENRKFNRTLLSYIYVLLVHKGQGGVALEIAQQMRSHSDYETTNIYLHIPEKELNKLTRHLFHRGNFGYIASLFADIIIGKPVNREIRTMEIITLNNKFNNMFGIEVTSGFINKVLSEKRSIIDMILKMGKIEVIDYLFKLDCNLLPSKEENIQCLVSETGCINPSLSCRKCVYSIPNFYALAAITDSVTSLLLQFKEKIESSTYTTEKTKFANLLFMEMDILYEACKVFGNEEVFKFFKGEKAGYLNLLKQLDNINIEKDIEEYLTYLPKNM